MFSHQMRMYTHWALLEQNKFPCKHVKIHSDINRSTEQNATIKICHLEINSIRLMHKAHFPYCVATTCVQRNSN